jgi:general secretion pathway protein M
MSAQMASLQAARSEFLAKWQAMAPRERQLVTVMAWLLGLVLVVMVGVRPALKTLKDTPVQLREVNATLDEMRRLADEVKTLRQMPPVPVAQAEAMLSSATKRLGEGSRVRIQGDRAIVSLNKVSGARLAEWLTEVRSGARMRPLDSNLTQTEPGLYSGSITLAFSGAPAPGR